MLRQQKKLVRCVFQLYVKGLDATESAAMLPKKPTWGLVGKIDILNFRNSGVPGAALMGYYTARGANADDIGRRFAASDATVEIYTAIDHLETDDKTGRGLGVDNLRCRVQIWRRGKMIMNQEAHVR